jgi:hypothetical protein
MRVSNDDRERVAQFLHTSMAEGRITLSELEERLDKLYASKTYGDLEPLTRDLPAGQQVNALQLPPQQAQGLPTPVNRVGGRGTSSTAIAVMSAADRKGMWTLPPTFNAVALMGGVELDLTEARFEDAETTIQAFAIMGAVEIYVPEDITVQVNGTGFMGAFDNRVPDQLQARPGVPLVRITGLAFWGAVEIKRRKKKSNKEIED